MNLKKFNFFVINTLLSILKDAFIFINKHENKEATDQLPPF